MDAKADTSRHWAHTSFCWFCRAVAQFLKYSKQIELLQEMKKLNIELSEREIFIVVPQHDKTNRSHLDFENGSKNAAFQKTLESFTILFY